MTSRMVGSVLTLVTLLFSVVGGAAQTYTQMQWGLNKGVTPYAFGANINGTWRDLGTVSAAGAWALNTVTISNGDLTMPYFVRTSGFTSVPASQLNGFWVALDWGISPHPEWGDVPGDFTRNTILHRCATKFDAQKAEYCFNFDSVVSTGASPNWQSGIFYAAGSEVVSSGNLYTTVAGGTSGGTAPTWTSGSSSDGGVTWTFVNIAIINNKVGIGNAVLTKDNAGATWGIANALTYNSPVYLGSFFTAQENDLGVGNSQDCAIGFANCFLNFNSGNTLGMMTALSAYSMGPQPALVWTASTSYLPHAIVQTTVAGTTRIYTSSNDNTCTGSSTPPSGTGTFTDGTCNWSYIRDGNTSWASHFGLWLNGSNLVKDVAIFEQTNANIGLQVTGTKATAAIDTTSATTPLFANLAQNQNIAFKSGDWKLGYVFASNVLALQIGAATPWYINVNGVQYAAGLNIQNSTAAFVSLGLNGVAAPGAGSVGEKLQLYGALGTAAASDYAIGVDAGWTWFTSGGGYRFYDATGNVKAEISAAGGLTLSAALKMPSYTVSTLPTCNAGAEGSMAYVTDATAPTYNGALTGGGAVKVPVFCDGTAWTSH